MSSEAPPAVLSEAEITIVAADVVDSAVKQLDSSRSDSRVRPALPSALEIDSMRSSAFRADIPRFLSLHLSEMEPAMIQVGYTQIPRVIEPLQNELQMTVSRPGESPRSATFRRLNREQLPQSLISELFDCHCFGETGLDSRSVFIAFDSVGAFKAIYKLIDKVWSRGSLSEEQAGTAAEYPSARLIFRTPEARDRFVSSLRNSTTYSILHGRPIDWSADLIAPPLLINVLK